MWLETNIFEYEEYVTGRKLYADPLTIRRSLMKHTGSNLDDLIDKQNSPAPSEREEADESLIISIRKTFGLDTIDNHTGAGVTDAYCLNLLGRFIEYYDSKKNSTEMTPTS